MDQPVASQKRTGRRAYRSVGRRRVARSRRAAEARLAPDPGDRRPAGEEPAIAPMRVLRCEIAALDHVTARYRGACEFVRPLELPALMPKPHPSRPLHDSWRSTSRSRCSRSAIDAIPAAASASRMSCVCCVCSSRAPHRLTATGWRARSPTCCPRWPARSNSVPIPRPVLAVIESRLRLALPQVDVRLTDGPLPPTGSGAEMILFRPDRLSDRGCVLNVELPHGSTLDDWQFRLLQASMHLCSLLDDGPSAGSPSHSNRHAVAARGRPLRERPRLQGFLSRLRSVTAALHPVAVADGIRRRAR